MNTAPRLPPDAVTRLLDAAFDVVALSFAAVSPRVFISKGLIRPIGNERERLSAYNQLETIRGTNLLQGIKVVRRTELRVTSVTYQNPFESNIEPLGAAISTTKGIAGFFNNFLNGITDRQHRKAQTEALVINNTVMDATIEESVEMQFERLESMKVDNALKREELRAAQLKNKRKAIQYAREAHELQQRFKTEGPRWDVVSAQILLNNVRLLTSIDLLASTDAELTIEEGDSSEGA